MRASRSGQFEEINITPLTDVFLVLLVIMMLVAPLIDLKGLDMGMPDLNPTNVNPDDSKTLRVEVTASGEYRVDNQPVPKDGLVVAIQDMAPNKPEGVFLDPNPEADLEFTAFAISAINMAGITDISIDDETEDTSSGPADAGTAPAAALAATPASAPAAAPVMVQENAAPAAPTAVAAPPETKPETKPVAKPAAKPAIKPVAKPTAKPAVKPAKTVPPNPSPAKRTPAKGR